MFAHYTATKLVKFVTISDNKQGRDGTRYNVAGKREAAAIAAQHNAKRWNF